MPFRTVDNFSKEYRRLFVEGWFLIGPLFFLPNCILALSLFSWVSCLIVIIGYILSVICFIFFSAFTSFLALGSSIAAVVYINTPTAIHVSSANIGMYVASTILVWVISILSIQEGLYSMTQLYIQDVQEEQMSNDQSEDLDIKFSKNYSLELDKIVEAHERERIKWQERESDWLQALRLQDKILKNLAQEINSLKLINLEEKITNCLKNYTISSCLAPSSALEAQDDKFSEKLDLLQQQLVSYSIKEHKYQHHIHVLTEEIASFQNKLLSIEEIQNKALIDVERYIAEEKQKKDTPVEAQLSQLRQQFQEKSCILMETKKELFFAKEQILALEHMQQEKSLSDISDLCIYESLLSEYTTELEIQEQEIIELYSLLNTFMSPENTLHSI